MTTAPKATFAALFVTLICPVANAAYVVNLAAEARQFSSGFIFYPYITARENDAATDAFMTFTSPNVAYVDPDGTVEYTYRGHVNHPQRTLTTSFQRPSTSDLVGDANGEWRITVEDSGSTYEYAVDIELSLPFSDLPRLSSPAVTSGVLTGPLTWSLVGGSAEYPGPASGFFTSLRTLSFATVDTGLLTSSDASWDPAATLTDGAQYRVSIQTRLEALDTSALRVLEVRSLTAGAPDLRFAAPSVKYVAELEGIVTAIAVPEPTSPAIAGFAVSGILAALRRSRAAR